MKRSCLPMMIAVMILHLAAGCAGNAPQEVVLGETPTDQAETSSEQEDRGEWDDLQLESSGDSRTRPRFIPADNARRAPELTVQSFGGEKRKTRLGYEGRVTVLVFWSMDSTANQGAVVHLDGLVDRYHRMGVRGINVVEKPPTESHRAAPRFLNAQGVQMRTYYDDFSALRKMAKAARAGVKWDVPCIFLVDRAMRVRFFKRGFSFSGAATGGPRGRQVRVMENAPRGKRVEDFLRRLIEER